MQPLAMDLRVLRALLAPDLRIAPGRALMARVVDADGNGRGSLSIAGFLLEAELPAHVRAGEDLRLVVKDVSAERVLLGISAEHQEAEQTQGQGQSQTVATPQSAIAQPVPLPGGGFVQVTEREARSGGGSGSDSGTQRLSLRYDAPALGAVDLRFELSAGALALGVTVAPGDAHEAAQAAAAALREALAGALGRAVSVTVSARREPIDVYA
jgi:hypothetical protein